MVIVGDQRKCAVIAKSILRVLPEEKNNNSMMLDNVRIVTEIGVEG